MAHLLGYEVRSVMFESNPITGEVRGGEGGRAMRPTEGCIYLHN